MDIDVEESQENIEDLMYRIKHYMYDKRLTLEEKEYVQKMYKKYKKYNPVRNFVTYLKRSGYDFNVFE
jgi:hypothetical protein